MEPKKTTRVLVLGGPVVRYWPETVRQVLEKSAVGDAFVAPGCTSGERSSTGAFDHILRVRGALLSNEGRSLVVQPPVTDATLSGLVHALAERLVPFEALDIHGINVVTDPHDCFERVLNDPTWRHVTFADVELPIRSVFGRSISTVHTVVMDPYDTFADDLNPLTRAIQGLVVRDDDGLPENPFA